MDPMDPTPSALDTERAFLQQVARQRVTTYDEKTWSYFDAGRRGAEAPPLVCLPGTSGTARCFHRQMLTLAAKGYRVISVQYPVVWTHEEWIQCFDRFLDAINVTKIHIYGVSLGAYLAQRYAAQYPQRVLSLVLTQPFFNPQVFEAGAPRVKMFGYMPEFYLKKYILDRLPKQQLGSPALVDAVDYMAEQVNSLTQQELASRLVLLYQQCDPTKWSLSLAHNRITILDSYEETTIPASHMDEMRCRYPRAKQAMMKEGGFFPFVSHHDEVSMLLQVHLRANGAFIG